jgi:DNA-binding transcriptional ArsR family regulator
MDKKQVANRERVDLDSRRLKALAHPLRIELLGLLRAYGPATSTELAQRIGETTSGTTSWHLRRLAEHGFVQEAAEQPSGRERRWEAVHRATYLDTSTTQDPENRVAVVEFMQHVLDLQVRRIRAWMAERPNTDPEWVDASMHTDRLLRLTPDRLAALGKELQQVLSTYMREAEALADDPDARLVDVVLHAFPRTDEQPSPPPTTRLT